MNADSSEINIANNVRRETTYFLFVAAAAFVVALPILLFGFPSAADDALFHFNVYKNFRAALAAGDVYPRWLAGMNQGFGSPTFFYYPPFAYYATAAINSVAGAPATEAQVWRQLGFGVVAAVVASGATCYWWLRDFANRRAAAAAAIVYLLLPYHVAVDVYLRGAFAELWAFVWLPPILKAVQNVDQKRARAFAGIAAFYALLIATHLPSALLFSPLPPVYGWFAGARELRLRRVGLIVAAMNLGVGIAAIYLLPALLLRDAVSFDVQQSEYYRFANWFLFAFSNEQNAGDRRVNLIFSALLGATLAGLILCLIAKRFFGEYRRFEKIEAFWWATAIASVFMMTPPSNFVWRLLPVLQAVQFPFRFNTILCVAAAALVAITLEKTGFFAKTNWLQNKLLFGAAALAICAVWCGLLVYAPVGKMSAAAIEASRCAASSAAIRRLELDAHEYTVRAVKTDKIALLERLAAENRLSGAQHFLRAENANAAIEEWKPRRIILNATAAQPANLIVGQFYFPGWTATRSGEQVTNKIAVEPSPEGLLQTSIPAGSSRVELTLPAHWTETAGAWISLSSVVLTTVAALFLNRFNARFENSVNV